MIATARTSDRVHVTQETAKAFEAMLPTIQRVALYGFRRAPRWRREELIQDTIAKAYESFVKLVERGAEALAYPTVLANYSVRQIRQGRRLGAKQNVQDAMSDFAQRKKGFSLQQLSSNDARGGWEEL